MLGGRGGGSKGDLKGTRYRAPLFTSVRLYKGILFGIEAWCPYSVWYRGPGAHIPITRYTCDGHTHTWSTHMVGHTPP